MASAIGKKICPVCKKNVGIATCDGCEQSFCSKHFIEHRQDLSQQMDNIGQDHDLLQRDIGQKNTEHPLFARINKWEQESIVKIQTAAESARTDLHELIEKNKQDLKKSVTIITNELQASRESDNYTEIDIGKWTQQIRKLREMLESPRTVSIDEDRASRSSIHLISMRTRQNRFDSPVLESNEQHFSIDQNLRSSVNERFDQVDGIAELSEGGRVVTKHAEALFPRSSTIYGINQYTSGTHDLHFRIEMSGSSFIFMGIISVSEKLTNKKDRSDTSRYGWWGLNQTVKKGEVIWKRSDSMIESGDDVTLTLRCDHQQIQLKHNRTNRSVQLSIDLNACPFPWRMSIKLQSLSDCVRIL